MGIQLTAPSPPIHPLPDELRKIVSKASLSFAVEGEIAGHLEFSLSSDLLGLMSDSQPLYQIEYSLTFPEGVSVNSAVSLKPRSEILKGIFLKSPQLEALEPSTESKSISLPYPFSQDSPITAYSDVIDIAVGSTPVASFPVTFFASQFN